METAGNTFNNVIYAKNTGESVLDYDPATVSERKIWKKYGNTYRCGNCGYIPTYVDIRDWKVCPKCEVLKSFCETDHGLERTYFWYE